MTKRSTKAYMCVILSAGLLLTGCSGSKKNTAASTAAATTKAAKETTAAASTEAPFNTLSEEERAQKNKMIGLIESIDTESNTVTLSVMGSSAGGYGGFTPGNMPNGGFNGQMPNGESFNAEDFDGQVPEGFDAGQMPNGGFSGQMPNGESFNAEDFDGQVPEGFTAGQMPNGGFNGQMPDGESFNAEDFDGQVPEGFTAESRTYTVTPDTVITDADGNTITIADLAEADYVEFTVLNGNLLTVTVTVIEETETESEEG